MPIYEYECSGGHITAHLESLAAAKPRRRCWCSARARRILSAHRVNTDAVITAADVDKAYGRDTRWDRNLQAAFPPPWNAGRREAARRRTLPD